MSSTDQIPILPGLGALVGAYDGIVLDLWGVVHDGRTPYPDACATLLRLREAGKRVVMLSNAPRRSSAVIEGMTTIGVARDLYTDVLSSGELVWRALSARTDPWMRALGTCCLLIGPERDVGLLDGLGLVRITAPEKGAFILNTGPWHDEETVADYEALLRHAARLAMPMICANPDLEVIRGGVRIICAGSLAARYGEIGGDVRQFGKPHGEAYDACLDIMGMADKARLLAVGDSLETDIRGAAGAGIDAVLVTSGIHGTELGLTYGESADPVRLAAACARAGVRPIAAIPALVW